VTLIEHGVFDALVTVLQSDVGAVQSPAASAVANLCQGLFIRVPLHCNED
jgi:hypothetical protein